MPQVCTEAAPSPQADVPIGQLQALSVCTAFTCYSICTADLTRNLHRATRCNRTAEARVMRRIVTCHLQHRYTAMPFDRWRAVVWQTAAARATMHMTLANMRQRAAGAALRAWRSAAGRRAQNRGILAAAMTRLRSGALAAAFVGWRLAAGRSACNRGILAVAVARLRSAALGAAFSGWHQAASQRARLHAIAHQVVLMLARSARITLRIFLKAQCTPLMGLTI